MSPGSLLVVAIGGILLAGVWLAVGIWIALDARARGSTRPMSWAIFGLLPGIGLLLYLIWWRRGHDRQHPPSTYERGSEIIAAAGIGWFFIGAIVSPPDVFTQLSVWLIVFLCCLPLAYWLTGRFHSSTSNQSP